MKLELNFETAIQYVSINEKNDMVLKELIQNQHPPKINVLQR